MQKHVNKQIFDLLYLLQKTKTRATKISKNIITISYYHLKIHWHAQKIWKKL